MNRLRDWQALIAAIIVASAVIIHGAFSRFTPIPNNVGIEGFTYLDGLTGQVCYQQWGPKRVCWPR